MTLGERICKLRTDKNLSQQEQAERLEVSRQSVSKWETDASVPDLDKLVKLCEVFDVSLDELVRGICRDQEEQGRSVLIVREGRGPSSREIMGIVIAVLGILGIVLFLVKANVVFALMIPLVIVVRVALRPEKRFG